MKELKTKEQSENTTWIMVIPEACGEFVHIKLAHNDGNKLFTKEALIIKIILGLYSFIPAQFSVTYATEQNLEHELFLAYYIMW